MYWSMSSKEPLSIREARVEITPVGEVSSLRMAAKVSETRVGVISTGGSLASDGWAAEVKIIEVVVVSD